MKPILFSTPMVQGKVCPVCGARFERNGRHLTNWKRMVYCSRECVAESQRMILDEEKVTSLFASGHTSFEIAEIFGCSVYPVKKALERHEMRRPAKPRPSVMSGENNPSWKGGRRIRSDGYVVLWTPEGERLEHQVIMESHLGRKLTIDEIVHHKDRNKQNNDISNLAVLSRKQHAEEHAREMRVGRYGA